GRPRSTRVPGALAGGLRSLPTGGADSAHFAAAYTARSRSAPFVSQSLRPLTCGSPQRLAAWRLTHHGDPLIAGDQAIPQLGDGTTPGEHVDMLTFDLEPSVLSDEAAVVERVLRLAPRQPIELRNVQHLLHGYDAVVYRDRT